MITRKTGDQRGGGKGGWGRGKEGGREERGREEVDGGRMFLGMIPAGSDPVQVSRIRVLECLALPQDEGEAQSHV